MAFPLPTDLVNDTTGLIEGMAKWAYIVTGGWFWTALLLGFCVVLFTATSRYSTERAFGFAGIAGMLGAMMLVAVGLMSWWVAGIFIIVGIVGVVSMVVKNQYI